MDLANLPAVASDKAAFLQGMRKLDMPQSSNFMRIAEIRLDAKKEKKWYEDIYNPATKDYTRKLFQDFTDGTFLVTPILTTSFVRWKGDPKDNIPVIESNEFIDGKNNPLHLYRITKKTEYAKRTKTKIESYPNYDAFKAKYETIDPLTQEKQRPYAYIIVLYAYHHASKRLIQIHLRGYGRGAWFNFRKELGSREDVVAMCQTKVRIGMTPATMNNGDSIVHASFSLNALVNDVELGTIMEATNELANYLRKKHEVGDEHDDADVIHQDLLDDESEVQTVQPAKPLTQTAVLQTGASAGGNPLPDAGQEIRLEDIPF